MKTQTKKQKKCGRCGYNRFTTYKKILVCSECGLAKTKWGKEKLMLLGIKGGY